MSIVKDWRSLAVRSRQAGPDGGEARERLAEWWAPVLAEIDLPACASWTDDWEGEYPERVVFGLELGVTACPVVVQASAVQNALGGLRERIVSIEGHTDRGLQSWQARALAALPVEAEYWVTILTAVCGSAYRKRLVAASEELSATIADFLQGKGQPDLRSTRPTSGGGGLWHVYTAVATAARADLGTPTGLVSWRALLKGDQAPPADRPPKDTGTEST